MSNPIKYTDEEINLVLHKHGEGLEAWVIAMEVNRALHHGLKVLTKDDVLNIIQHYTKRTGGH